MNIGLELNVFCLSDEDIKLAELEIDDDVPLENCITRKYTFYEIAYVSEHRNNPKHSLVGSNNDEFIVKENCADIRHRIEQIRTLRFN